MRPAGGRRTDRTGFLPERPETGNPARAPRRAGGHEGRPRPGGVAPSCADRPGNGPRAGRALRSGLFGGAVARERPPGSWRSDFRAGRLVWPPRRTARSYPPPKKTDCKADLERPRRPPAERFPRLERAPEAGVERPPRALYPSREAKPEPAISGRSGGFPSFPLAEALPAPAARPAGRGIDRSGDSSQPDRSPSRPRAVDPLSPACCASGAWRG